MQGGDCAGGYVHALLELATALQAQGDGIGYHFSQDDGDPFRNAAAAALLTSSHTHLVFIGANLHFRVEDVLRMLDSGEDIVVGLCPRRKINWDRVSEAYADGVRGEDLAQYAAVIDTPKTWNPGYVFETKAADLDFAIVSRRVFEKLRLDAPPSAPGSPDAHEFFSPSTEPGTGRSLSGDFHFCAIARRNKIRVLIDPHVQLGRYGQYLFTGSTAHLTPPPPAVSALGKRQWRGGT